jgi:hypothetical protein
MSNLIIIFTALNNCTDYVFANILILLVITSYFTYFLYEQFNSTIQAAL